MVDDGYFRTRLAFDPGRDPVWREVAAYLQRFVPPAAAVLDLGAGYATFVNNIRARERHALDLSPTVREYAAAGVEVHVMGCDRVAELGRDRFDVVFESFLLEHLERAELDACLAGILAVLKPGGLFLAVQPNFATAFRHYFDDYTHRLVFTHVSLADLLVARGFDLVEVRPRFLPFSLRSHLPRARWLVRAYLRSPVKPFSGNMLVVARKPGAEPASG